VEREVRARDVIRLRVRDWPRRAPESKDNLRSRVIAVAIERANEALGAAGQAPLPSGLTPHGLGTRTRRS
jgi:hypothetical protein